MEKADRNALIALPLVIFVAVGITWAGSQRGDSVLGIPIFALAVVVIFVTLRSQAGS